MKKIILIVLAVIALPFILALFLKKSYHVERSIKINKSQAEIFAFLKYVKNQKKFTVWSQYDPNQKELFTGPDGQVGFVHRWESEHEKVGVGEIEIAKLTPNSRIDYNFRFYKPFKALEDTGYFQIDTIGPGLSKVSWGYDGKMSYPSNLFILFLNFEEMIGNEFATGLENLKKYIE